jgi:hypothetical protein
VISSRTFWNISAENSTRIDAANISNPK